MKISTDANFPMDAEGRVYHLAIRRGELANRIVQVGDPARLRRFSSLLDPSPPPFECTSSRGFTVVTGRYHGVPTSLVASGMGAPMIDFFVREARAVVEGDVAIIRFGSCGSLDPSFGCGSLGVPLAAMSVTTNYAATRGVDVEPYLFSPPIAADPSLHATLLETLNSSPDLHGTDIRPVPLHASADFFYSTQGRLDPSFDDQNTNHLESMKEKFPAVMSIEMETEHLFYLASIHRPNPALNRGPIRAAAVHMTFANRFASGLNFIDPDVTKKLEPLVGRACLDALVATEIVSPHPDVDAVWRL